MIQFICGCDSKLEPPIDREILKTFDSVIEDWQGHLVCLVHKERLKGWRSVPYTAATMSLGIDCASWTPLEWEHWRIFGVFPRTRPLKITVSGGPSNRDPEKVGREYLAAMATARNGNVVANRHGQTALDNLRGDWPR